MKYYVINLDRSKSRLTSMREGLERFDLSFVRIPAIEGSALSKHEINVVYDFFQNKRQYFSPLKSVEIACFLSHRAAWQIFLESFEYYAIIMEDDVEWRINPEQMQATLESILNNPEARLIKLFCKRSVDHKLHEDKLCVVERSVVVPLGMVAYAVNRPGAEKLLNSTCQVWEPVDVAVQRWWVTKVRIFACMPSLVREISPSLGGSTLKKGQREPKLVKIIREIRRPLFRLQIAIESYARFFNEWLNSIFHKILGKETVH